MKHLRKFNLNESYEGKEQPKKGDLVLYRDDEQDEWSDNKAIYFGYDKSNPFYAGEHFIKIGSMVHQAKFVKVISKENNPEINYDIWTTKSGKTIPVSKMSIEHLINTLNAILNYTVKFKSIEVKENWARTILEEILKREKQTTEIPKDLKESFEEYDDEDEDGPHIEPEDCECKEEMEESGIEYTQDFYWDKDLGVWVCEHCGGHQ